MTFDLDFADPRRFPPAEFAGLVVLRLRVPTSKLQVRRIVSFFAAQSEVAGRLWIVDEETGQVLTLDSPAPDAALPAAIAEWSRAKT